MKRKIITAVLCLLIILAISACTSSVSDYPAAIMVNDIVYLFSNEDIPVEIGETAILGYTNYVDGWPSKNGETNFHRKGNLPYALYENGVIVQIDNEWIYCEPQNDATGDADEAVVLIDYAAEDLLTQPDAFYEFIADESEQQAKVVFSTNALVRNFKVLSMNMEDVSDEGEMSFSISEELYSLEKLTAEKPLVVGMVFVGSTPNMGISYIDNSGVEKLYAISMSGKDGELLLLESNLIE